MNFKVLGVTVLASPLVKGQTPIGVFNNVLESSEQIKYLSLHLYFAYIQFLWSW